MTKTKTKTVKTLPYVIVRAQAAGVWAGYLVSRDGREVKLERARRLWFWKGASCLSEIASKGVSKPAECKFSAPVEVEILDAIEVISATPEAKASVEGVPEWSAR